MNGVRCEQGPSRAPPAAGTSVGTVPCAGCRPSCGQGCPLPEPQRSRRCAEIAAGAARPLLQQEAPRAAAHPAQGWDSVPRPPKLRAERCPERWLYPYVGGSSERDMAAGPPLGGGRTRSPCSQLLAPVSAAVWNFPSANEHHLPLEIGETVHILQASEGKGSRLGWG